MCSQVKCNQCGKPTWTGCGQHVEDALRDVPVAQRCKGHEQTKPKSGRVLSRIFGKR